MFGALSRALEQVRSYLFHRKHEISGVMGVVRAQQGVRRQIGLGSVGRVAEGC